MRQHLSQIADRTKSGRHAVVVMDGAGYDNTIWPILVFKVMRIKWMSAHAPGIALSVIPKESCHYVEENGQ